MGPSILRANLPQIPLDPLYSNGLESEGIQHYRPQRPSIIHQQITTTPIRVPFQGSDADGSHANRGSIPHCGTVEIWRFHGSPSAAEEGISPDPAVALITECCQRVSPGGKCVTLHTMAGKRKTLPAESYASGKSTDYFVIYTKNRD